MGLVSWKGVVDLRNGLKEGGKENYEGYEAKLSL